MPFMCSVAGCKSNYRSERNERSITTFALPKDDRLKQKWVHSIPTDLTKLKNPRICIKHFDEQDVIRVDRILVNNEIQEYERKYPKLQPEAVPTIFKGLPSYSTKKTGSVRRLCDVQSFAEHQKWKKVNNLEDILTFYKNSGLLDKNWVLVREGSHIFVYYISFNNKIPSLEGSVCISEDLSITFNIGQDALNQQKIPIALQKVTTKTLESVILFLKDKLLRQQKITEQSRLIKLKEKDELKIKQLYNEITSMKSMKIKLLKQMREESDRFRSWKHQAERELAKIKEKDRKKQTEIVKMKLTYEKQKNVLKRKFEEAAALNKRLQSTFMKRKQAQEMRFNGKVEKIVAWLKDDFEVYLSLVEAETALSELLEDRATLYLQLDELKNNPETADRPEVKTLEEDIELRSVQIQDLQQKLLDSDEETKAKTRFDSVQTMVEAKYALRALYEQAAEALKEKLLVKREISELQENQKELLEKVESNAQTLKAQADDYMEQLANQQKSYEEKVSILLRQLRGIKNEDEDTDSELTTRCQILNERLEQQEKQNEEQQNIIRELKKRLEDIEKTSMQALTPIVKKKKESVPKIKVSTDSVDKPAEHELDDDDILEGSFEDDNEKDPDWRKTPLGKRILAEKKLKMMRSSQLPNELGGSKRSSEGGCTCKTKCNSSRCGCRKLIRGCGSSCKCSDGVCENRNLNEVSSTEDSSQSICSVNSLDGDSESAFKRPRVEEENVPMRRRKLKNKLLFLE